MRRCSASCSGFAHLREVEPVEALIASNARQLGDGGALCNCRYLQAHRPEPDTLVGHSSQAGLALERAVFTSDSARARLPNELRPVTAGRGGFAFSGVTASAESFAVGGDVCETLGEGQGAPGSDMSVFARSADFPPCFVT